MVKIVKPWACTLIANTRIGQLRRTPDGSNRFELLADGSELLKGASVMAIGKPIFAIDANNQTVLVVKARCRVNLVLLKDIWLPFARLENSATAASAVSMTERLNAA
jgi:hypothetical protein